jgi:thymidylate synthase (FAD)
LGSYSQSSQRYINYNKKGIEVICPSSIGAPVGEYEIDVYRGLINGEHKSEWNWLLAVANTYNEYNYQIEQGIKPEDARYILPNCVATQIAVTFNLRMWKYVFKERALNKYAQWEIRQLFSSILELFSKELPCFFGDLIV